MDANEHAVLLAQIRDWLDARPGHAMSVKVHSGSQTEYVASGPYLRLEEHPTAPGVCRALFDDSLASGPGVPPKYVAFGFELQGVHASGNTLVLDKGTQQVEIVDLVGDPQAVASGDVWWPEDVRAEVADTAAAPPQYAAPQPPSPAAPPSPAPAQVPQRFELLLRAPAYANSLGARFSGPVTLRLEQGWMSITGKRSATNGPGYMMTAGTLLIVFGALAFILAGVAAGGSDDPRDTPITIAVFVASLVMLVPGIPLRVVGQSRAGKAPVSTLQFRLAEAKGDRVRYDDNLGCLLMLLLSIPIGLIIMLAMGRRVLRMNVPDDTSPNRSRQIVILKTLSNADGALLQQAIARERSMWVQ